MTDLTPPSSSANTPKREMDIDEHERRYSSGSEEGEPGASDTELDEPEPIETGQATPPLVEGEAAASTSTVSVPGIVSLPLHEARFHCLSSCFAPMQEDNARASPIQLSEVSRSS